ncbi:MAG: VOC family protein [Clostridia bacterium]|nr:VOC family protein [Clostridia bacterium]
MPEKPIFTSILQVAVVVKDCDASVRKYTDEYGIGPWSIYEFNPDTVDNMILRGKPQGYAMRLALAEIGGVQFELIEPKDDKSIYAEFLKQHGEGLHHVAFGVENYNKAMEFFGGKGHGILQGGTWHGFTYTYLTTQQDLGLIAEIYDPPPDFQWPEPDAVYPKKS